MVKETTICKKGNLVSILHFARACTVQCNCVWLSSWNSCVFNQLLISWRLPGFVLALFQTNYSMEAPTED